ncbi:uncharacterized protein LOC101164867 [Oryzias latipes]|uniref:uncharacterized protein LOC101164867 n=1 Tax=Oryzias latipes TaxID=8090 RepID=UPI0005CC1467|nr:uncharacterized protein LOC101164867 [Oryzias latipes]
MALLFGGLLITSGIFVAGSHDSVAATIQAQEGETAHLPFNFSGINLQNQTLDLRRVDGNFTDSNKYVFSIRDGKENFEPQSESYKNRVFVNQTSLISGIVILEISSVNRSDSGVYRLTVPKLKKTQTLTLDVKESEMKNKEGKYVNTTTAEEQKDEAQIHNNSRLDGLPACKRHHWFAVTPVALFFITIIIIIVPVKIWPWSPNDEVKSPSCEMKIKEKDSTDVEDELLRV